jgi:hypothetical protein
MSEWDRATSGLDRLPPLPPSGVAELDNAVSEYQALADKHKAARRHLVDLKAQRKAAEQADLKAAADALRDGKPDPGPVHVDKLEAELGRTLRDVDVLAQAATDTGNELRDLVGVHRDALTARYEAERAKARAKVAKAADALATAISEVAAADLGTQQATHWPKIGKAAPPHIEMQVAGHRERLAIAAVLDAFRAFGSPEPGEALAEWIEPGRVAALLGCRRLDEAKNPVAELVKVGRIAERVEHLKDETNQPAPQYWYRSADVLRVARELQAEKHRAKLEARRDRQSAVTGSPAA